MGDAGFPFLFHGTAPDDWFDEPVHAWLVRFVRDPSKAERAALAAVWERATRDHARGLGADLAEPWLWNGGWALVRVRPGDRSRETMRALFAAMQSMLRATHTAAPIAEVIYAQASDVSSGSEWEAWTVEQSPVASEAPPWPPEVVTHMKRSRKRTKTSVDDAFETARSQARADLDATRVAAITPSVDDADEPEEEEAPDASSGDDDGDDSGDDDSGSDDSDEVTLPEPRGFPLRLEEISTESLDEMRETSEGKRPDAENSQVLADDTWLFKPKGKKNKPAPLSLYSRGETVECALSSDSLYAVKAWSPERRELLVASQDYLKLEVFSLADTAGREVWSDVARDSMHTVCCFADGAFAVFHSHGVSVYPSMPADPSRGSHHAWQQENTILSPRRRALVSNNGDEATVVRVTAFVNGALRVAGEVAVRTPGWCSIEQIDGDIYLSADERAYRIDGIEEAVDALLASPGDTERFPEIERVVSPEERNDPARNSEADDCYNRACTAKEEQDDALAERWYRRNVELAPTNAMGWHGLGHVLQRMGREADGKVALERAVAEYDAQIAAGNDDDDIDDLRFWRAAALSRLHRRDEVMAALRALIAEGHTGNYRRQEVSQEEDFAWLKSDAEFMALTAKVARPKRAAAKKTTKRGAVTRDESDDEGDDD